MARTPCPRDKDRAHVEPEVARRIERWLDDLLLLGAQVAALAGVWVEAAHANARMSDAKELLQAAVQHTQHREQTIVGYRVGHGTQWQMRGGQCDA